MDIDDVVRPAGSSELREANKPIRLLEQDAEVLKRAPANVSQGLFPGKGFSRS